MAVEGFLICDFENLFTGNVEVPNVEGRTETKSEKTRHVIFRREDGLYYVSMVSVRFNQGFETHKAVFHARRAKDDYFCDIDLEIPQKLYDILVDYTNLGDPDLILVVAMENNQLKWSMISEKALRRYSDTKSPSLYIV